MRKIVALILAVVTLLFLVGCAADKIPTNNKSEKETNKEVTKNETPQVEDDTDEKIKKEETNSLVGTWVVTKTEVYDGPLKTMAEQITNTYYYVGSEHEFTADGTYKNADGTLTTHYSILDENHITMTEIGSGDAVIYDYELNGDEYVQYGNYTGTAANLGHANAVYFKRK